VAQRGGQTLLDSTTSYDRQLGPGARAATTVGRAEILIDAGATVQRRRGARDPHGRRGMLHLLARKQARSRTLPVAAALGDETAYAPRSTNRRRARSIARW
jgi:hypothetical protein